MGTGLYGLRRKVLGEYGRRKIVGVHQVHFERGAGLTRLDGDCASRLHVVLAMHSDALAVDGQAGRYAPVRFARSLW